MTTTATTPDTLVRQRFSRTSDALSAFIDAEADQLARACLEMARRFQRGGRLLVVAGGARASDAAHVAVEFVHPVLVGKRALPAIALNDGATALEALARPADIALALSHDDCGDVIRESLARARALGLLTVHLSGGLILDRTLADFPLRVASDDAMVVQEVHETAYHVLWELVHVFFEHGVV